VRTVRELVLEVVVYYEVRRKYI